MALAKPATLTVEEAATMGVALVNQGRPIALVALDLIDSVEGSAWRSLAAKGLAGHISAAWSADREARGQLPNEADGVETPPASDHLPGSIRHLLPANRPKVMQIEGAWERILAVTYDIAGERKAVRAWTESDARWYANTERNREHGHRKNREAGELVVKLLRRHKKDVVGALPRAAQQSIADALR